MHVWVVLIILIQSTRNFFVTQAYHSVRLLKRHSLASNVCLFFNKDKTFPSKLKRFTVQLTCLRFSFTSLLEDNQGWLLTFVQVKFYTSRIFSVNSPVYLIISGFIIDTTGCYTWAFFTAGIVTHVAGLVPLTLFCLKNKKDDDLKKDKTRKLLLWLTSFCKSNSFIWTFLSQTTTMTETTKKLSHNWCILVSPLSLKPTVAAFGTS